MALLQVLFSGSFSQLSGDGGGGRWMELMAHRRSFKGFFAYFCSGSFV
jgi:hypothetical protein